MQLPCPHCNFPVNLGEPPAASATCPACGATVKQASSAERSAIDEAFGALGQRPLPLPTPPSKADDKTPLSAADHNSRGVAFAAKGEYDQAIVEFNRSL